MRRHYSDNYDESYEYGVNNPQYENYDNGQGYEQYPAPQFVDPNTYEQYPEYADGVNPANPNEAYAPQPYGQNEYYPYDPATEYEQNANVQYDNNSAYYGGYYGDGAQYDGYDPGGEYAQGVYSPEARQGLEYGQEYAPLQAGYENAQEENAQAYYEPSATEYEDEYGYKEQAAEVEQKKKRSRGALITLIAGLVLIIGGAVLFLYPIVEKAYNAYVMQMDAKAFLRTLGNRTNYVLIDEASLPKAEVINLPAQYVDDTFSGEDETDYYNEDGTARTDIGAVSSRSKPESYAVLEIPKINLSIGMYVSEYFKQIYTHMRYGAGIYPGSAMPGTIGNCAVAAHRTGPSDFFRRLDELKPGDQMIVHTLEASYKYVVEDSWTIFPSDTSVIKPTDYAALTLTTCQAYKGVSNGKRLIIRGRLKELASD